MKNLIKKFIPNWLLSFYHWKWALLGALFFGWPSRKIKVIGVTGTKGKSTVVFLAGKILNAAGKKTGWVSSLTINDGQKEIMNPFHMTMPGRFFIQKTLRQMIKNGCQYAIVEVTSEGIKQHRHRFINWAGAVFTNLAPEHLEAHGGFENYRAAKMKLFAAAAKNKESFGVYNLDDENAAWFLKYPVKKKYGYGELTREILKEDFATLTITDIKLSAQGSEFKINNVHFKTNLLGEFNVYNCAAAAAIGEACDAPLLKASETLAQVQSIPGRLEIINEGQDFTVVVDLAHTPDSFEKVFKLFQNLPHERLISVFGSAGGGRDKWKRPELGRIASQYSDQIFICNEDPYDEDPLQIAEQIFEGSNKNKADIILDRREAIAKALSLARRGDIVLILGKGTEQTYVEGAKKIHWDDREVVRQELKKLTKIDNL
mgnify:CR=1 FL=1